MVEAVFYDGTNRNEILEFDDRLKWRGEDFRTDGDLVCVSEGYFVYRTPRGGLISAPKLVFNRMYVLEGAEALEVGPDGN